MSEDGNEFHIRTAAARKDRPTIVGRRTAETRREGEEAERKRERRLSEDARVSSSDRYDGASPNKQRWTNTDRRIQFLS